MKEQQYPPILPGTTVMTTEPDLSMRKEWTDEGWALRKWRVRGTVITHHDSHGLCYEVRHEDGTEACYNPNELKIMKRTIGGMIVNDKGELLPYTCRSTISQCEEAAEKDEFFVPGAWEKMKELGAKVVQVEIFEVV